jgi:hypothetical protein
MSGRCNPSCVGIGRVLVAVSLGLLGCLGGGFYLLRLAGFECISLLFCFCAGSCLCRVVVVFLFCFLGGFFPFLGRILQTGSQKGWLQLSGMVSRPNFGMTRGVGRSSLEIGSVAFFIYPFRLMG